MINVCICSKLQFQSTLPQGERPLTGHWHVRVIMISIHAPTRGATAVSSVGCMKNKISIHAPTRGATLEDKNGNKIWEFQSTLPQGERRYAYGYIRVSTDFNPRSHKGSDLLDENNFKMYNIFQSTLPQGERLQFSPILGLVLR